jgi:hypothetical protein
MRCEPEHPASGVRTQLAPEKLTTFLVLWHIMILG